MRRFNPAEMQSIGAVARCAAAVLVTTLALFTINSFVPTEHLMLGYLLPTIFVAIYFGSILAVLTSFAGGLAAAYFLLPPEFSFYIDSAVHIAELGFTIVLAIIASKVVDVLTYDLHNQARPAGGRTEPWGRFGKRHHGNELPPAKAAYVRDLKSKKPLTAVAADSGGAQVAARASLVSRKAGGAPAPR